MLECNKIDISEGIDVTKTTLSKEYDICHYWYFKDISFKNGKYICNGCYDLMQKAMSLNNVAIAYGKRYAYRIHFWYMSKDHTINIMNGSNFADKIFLLYIKMRESADLTYYQRNRHVILNRAKDHYELKRGEARDK